MLQAMRKGASGFLAKIFFTILMASFAVWGIGDIFRSGGNTTLAKIGEVTISPEEFRQSYTQELQKITQKLKKALSSQEARSFGLDQMVLSQLINEHSLVQEGKRLGLSVSAQTIANMVTQSESFKGPGGAFNKIAFEEALRNAGLSEASFLAKEKDQQIKILLVGSLSSEIKVPELFTQNHLNYTQEKRTLQLLDLANLVKETSNPQAQELEAYYNQFKTAFSLPQYRTVNVLTLNEQALGNALNVSEAELTKAYKDRLSEFSKPEKRQIFQMVLPNKESAQKVLDDIKSGTSFMQAAQALGKGQKDIDLGFLSQTEIIDKELAKAAFSLKKGEVSNSIAGAFGQTILMVNAIEEAQTKSLNEVKETLKAQLQKRQAQDLLHSLYDKIEDARAGGSTLSEIAKKEGLQIVEIAQLLQNGSTLNKQTLNLEKLSEIAQLAFTTAPNVETSPISIGNGGYIWIDVLSVAPARERTFEEAKADILEAWKKSELKKLREEKTNEALELVKNGQSLETIAQKMGLKVETYKDVTRTSNVPTLSAFGLKTAFTLKDKTAQVVEKADKSKTVLVQTVSSQKALTSSAKEDEKTAQTSLGNALSEDLGNAYAQALQKRQGISINQTLLEQTLGAQ